MLMLSDVNDLCLRAGLLIHVRPALPPSTPSFNSPFAFDCRRFPLGRPTGSALAAMHAQESATRIVYDLHQMLGAMGMTLEHPLHLWTYRMKALIAELGGRAGQARAVGELCFGASL